MNPAANELLKMLAADCSVAVVISVHQTDPDSFPRISLSHRGCESGST